MLNDLPVRSYLVKEGLHLAPYLGLTLCGTSSLEMDPKFWGRWEGLGLGSGTQSYNKPSQSTAQIRPGTEYSEWRHRDSRNSALRELTAQ